MKSIKLLTIALSLSAAGSLFAVPVDYTAAIDGLTPSGAVFTADGGASGGVLATDVKNGVTFLGVSGGKSGVEIDIDQSITVDFFSPVTFESLSLGLLFNGDEYGDNNEIAASLTNGADLFELRIVGEDAAEWYKNGVLQANAITGGGTTLGGFGMFTIWNPFDGILVDSLKLYPLTATIPYGSNSDFGLVAYTADRVPDAGSTIALLGVALLGVAGFARRSRRA